MKHTTEDHREPCNCRGVAECGHNFFAWKAAIDACVDDFAKELKSKLTRKFMDGKSGWDDPGWPIDDVLRQLKEHIDKGDMVDVAAFAMFAWNKQA